MRGIIAAAIGVALASAATVALAQEPGASEAQQPGALKQNQTQGYGAGKVLTFSYTQNFDCVDQPHDDLNFNKVQADADPSETQSPICQAGTDTTINPPGQKGKATMTTDPLYVLIPMFSTDNDQNPDDAIACKNVVRGTLCSKQLGMTLIKLFGALPEGFKETPKVFTQCPDGGLPPGTCTMHASQVDLAPVLAELGYISNPPTANVFVPLPNHSHLLADNQINQSAEWWQVLPVLVLNSADWPSQDGKSGISSVSALKAAEKAGAAVEAPSNFFLYFGSKMSKNDMKMNMTQ